MSKAVLLLVVPLIGGCGCFERTLLEGDSKANYRHIFGELPPDLKVVNSVVWCSCWTPDDWEFEIYAPASWIEEQKKSLSLVPGEPIWQDGAMFPGLFWRPNYASAWFSPGEPSRYELWDLRLTSIPYRHLYIDKSSKDKALIHAYYRKD